MHLLTVKYIVLHLKINIFKPFFLNVSEPDLRSERIEFQPEIEMFKVIRPARKKK